MRILLLMPSMKTILGRPYFVPWMNITLMHLKSLVDETTAKLLIEAKTDVIDERLLDRKFQASKDYDIVLLSFLIGSQARAYEIAKDFRTLGVPVIAGGVYTSLNPDEVLPYFNSIVVGEAENILAQLFIDLENKHLKKRYESKEVCDLKNLSIPDYDVFNHRLFFNSLPLFATRGCSSRCVFCTIPKLYKSSFRKRPIEDIYNQMRILKEKYASKGKFPPLTFNFTDDNICSDKIYAKKLFRRLKSLDIKWMGFGSLSADKELWQLAAESGCQLIAIGFESIDQRNLDYLSKGQHTASEHKACIQALHKASIPIVGLFMTGLPYDNKDTLDNLLRFIEENKIAFALNNIFTPLPGSKQWERKDWINAANHKNEIDVSEAIPVYLPKNMTHAEFRKEFVKFLKRLYSPWSIAKRLKHSNLATLTLNLGYMVEARKAKWNHWANGQRYLSKEEALINDSRQSWMNLAKRISV